MTVSLTVAQLFEPAPSGVGPYGNVPGVPASGTWLAVILNIATQVQLPTTSWQSGAPERTILAIEAVCFSQSDADISVMAQGSFLDSAASGSVTYVTTDGTSVTIPVTPDPSNAAQNPTGALGRLDLLTENVYDVTRLAATSARGPLAAVNVGGSAANYPTVGSYHVASAANGATYTNPAAVSIPPSTPITVDAVAPGLAYTIIATLTAHGLAIGDAVYINVPQSSGIAGLAGVFAMVVSVTTYTFQVQVASSGTWSSKGTIYACTTFNMVADAVGTNSNAGPGQVTVTVTQNANVFVSNVVGWNGSNWETNPDLAARAKLALAAASPNGPAQAYVYFAETAGQILGAESPPYIFTNGPVKAAEYANPQTGIVTTVVASSTPVSSVLGAAVTPGCAQLGITGVSNSNPCVISCAGTTGMLASGLNSAIVSGVLGTNGVNGSWLATYVSPTSFSIPFDSTSAGTYTGGGEVDAGDLGEIDALIQANVVPDGIVGAVTVSAAALPVVVVATVAVPVSLVSTYQLAAVTQLQTQTKSYGIGGDAPTNAIEYDDYVGALEEAGVLVLGAASYVRAITSLTLTVGGVNVPAGGSTPFPTNAYQAILVPPVLTVVGV